MSGVLQVLLSPRICRNPVESTEIDIKSGKILLIQTRGGKRIQHKLYMKIFRNAYEHHAQIYTDSDYKFMYGYISMRKCRITNNPGTKEIVITSERIREDSKTAHGLLFEAEHPEDVQGWIEALCPQHDLPSDSELSPGYETRSNIASHKCFKLENDCLTVPENQSMFKL